MNTEVSTGNSRCHANEGPINLFGTYYFLRLKQTEELHRRLVPYFRVEHPSRGALVGPYGKIPPRLQRLVLDVVMVSSDGSRGDVTAARDLINAVDLSAATNEYWKELKRIRAHS